MAQTADILCRDTSFTGQVYQLDPMVPAELGSWAVYSTCTVWSPLSLDSPFFRGTRVLDEQGCSGVQWLPGLCHGQEIWQSLLDTDISFFVLLQPECQALGMFPVRSGF